MRLIMYRKIYWDYVPWILYWITVCIWGFWIGSLPAFAFFSFPFTSFHFLSFPNYFFLKNLGDERRDRNEREMNKT